MAQRSRKRIWLPHARKREQDGGGGFWTTAISCSVPHVRPAHTGHRREREMHLGSTRGQRKEPSIVDNTYIMPKKEAFNMSDEQRQHIDYTGQFHQWYSHDMTNRLSLRIPAYLELRLQQTKGRSLMYASLTRASWFRAYALTK